MSNIIEIVSAAPAIIAVEGKTKLDRQLSVIGRADAYTKLALVNSKGKMGLAVRESIARGGLSGLARAAAWPACNYRPVAEYLAARLGEDIVVSNRAAFESLADRMEERILKAKRGKNDGMVQDKKTGALKDGAALKLARELKADITEVVRMAANYTAEAKAKAQADKQLEAPAA